MRTRLSGGCFNVAMEHQKAIVVLVNKHLNSSAFALLRLMYEAYIRGVWLHKCASKTDLDKFQNDKVPKYFKLVNDVEQLFSHEDGAFSRAKNNNWKALNSYTHTGFLQVVRQNSANYIEPNYSEDEIVEVVDAANSIGMLSAIAICDLAEANEVAMRILDEAKSY